MKKNLRKVLLLLGMLILIFVAYVEIVNLNSVNMTYRQKVLKAVYPVFMWWNKITGKKNDKLENEKTVPPVSFYSLKTTLNNGSVLNFSDYKGKKVLIVNTASDCGYTDQYEDLQKLFETKNLAVIGFPANDFKQQEKGTDEEIASFCKLNYGVNFPLAKKSVVVKSAEQNEVFRWLTDAKLNGWNEKQPAWNFSKYLVDEKGVLTHYFGSAVSPMSDELLDAIGN